MMLSSPPRLTPRSSPTTKLTIGQAVVICHCKNNTRTCIARRRPELVGARGRVTSIPIYPCTWVGVEMDGSGEYLKLRSSNFDIVNEAGAVMPVQTERLRRSIIFNALGPGSKVRILHHKRYTPSGGFPVIATILEKEGGEPK